MYESCTFDVMRIIFLGVAKDHIPSCLKVLRVLGYHYETMETDQMFLKRVSLEMKQDCKDQKIHVRIFRHHSGVSVSKHIW